MLRAHIYIGRIRISFLLNIVYIIGYIYISTPVLKALRNSMRKVFYYLAMVEEGWNCCLVLRLSVYVNVIADTQELFLSLNNFTYYSSEYFVSNEAFYTFFQLFHTRDCY